MASRNPTLKLDYFRNTGFESGDTMTIQGTVNKTFIALGILVASAAITWANMANLSGNLALLALISMFVALLVAFATVWRRDWAPVTTPVYAALEGIVLGFISAIFQRAYPGIVVPAIGLTFAVTFTMLFLYTSRIIPVTDKLRFGIGMATGGICLFYFIAWILMLFHVNMAILWSGSPVGIGFSLLVVGVAAFNLLLDFDMIERGAALGGPKYLEWYGAFGLLVTLVWLYLEILRLLAKFRSRR